MDVSLNLRHLSSAFPPFVPPPLTSGADFIPPTTPQPFDPLAVSFRPSIAVIIGVLTTMFALTFLLLLYAKHCKRRSNSSALPPFPGDHHLPSTPPPPLRAGRNSGVDRSIIDALPVFSFASLLGLKDGLECAVCLGRFEQPELLRLLPKCKHAFHLECVDTWLNNHSTCPLCRHRVEAEDVLMVEEFLSRGKWAGDEQQQQPPQPVSARNSTAGASTSARNSTEVMIDRSLQLYVKREGAVMASPSLRKGINSSSGKEGMRSGRKNLTEIDEQELARRLGHRIIVSDVLLQHRWSDFVPSDALFLEAPRFSATSRLEPARNSYSRINDAVSVATRSCNSDHDSTSMESSTGRHSSSTSRLSPIKGSRLEKPTMLKKTLMIGRQTPDAALLLPSYQRSLSEFAGMERYVGAQNNPLNDRDETTRRWFVIARKTLNWLTGSDKDSSGHNFGRS